eukprot:CAMPEP_0195282210 /NCGR_PEP_ID=MMETSP0707-20130614/1187_1 /TAXON_ID=33640 /ORGANISM="Asterionellopsis glacialis, Strain CCMP134" /LENGTH=374 /DNA_ID=CAMNT_0040341163 /DNA_START=17 /DNA_END=1141 /DNA_ORIENTATION=-
MTSSTSKTPKAAAVPSNVLMYVCTEEEINNMNEDMDNIDFSVDKPLKKPQGGGWFGLGLFSNSSSPTKNDADPQQEEQQHPSDLTASSSTVAQDTICNDSTEHNHDNEEDSLDENDFIFYNRDSLELQKLREESELSQNNHNESSQGGGLLNMSSMLASLSRPFQVGNNAEEKEKEKEKGKEQPEKSTTEKSSPPIPIEQSNQESPKLIETNGKVSNKRASFADTKKSKSKTWKSIGRGLERMREAGSSFHLGPVRELENELKDTKLTLADIQTQNDHYFQKFRQAKEERDKLREEVLKLQTEHEMALQEVQEYKAMVEEMKAAATAAGIAANAKQYESDSDDDDDNNNGLRQFKRKSSSDALKKRTEGFPSAA